MKKGRILVSLMAAMILAVLIMPLTVSAAPVSGDINSMTRTIINPTYSWDQITDGNDSTYVTDDTALGDQVMYEYATPRDVTGYYMNATGGKYYLKFYDENNGVLGSVGESLDDTTGTSTYVDVNVTNVKYVKLVARDYGGSIREINVRSASSDISPADTTAPATPTGLTASSGDGQVTLSWSANATDSDIKEYEIYKDGAYLNSVQHPGTSFIVSGLTNGTAYSFQLSAKDINGNESAKGAAVTATPQGIKPSVPTGLTATAGDGKVTLSWSANTDSPKEYEIYQDGVYLNSVQHPATTFEVSGLTNGTIYSFQLSAKGATGGESAKTTAVTATPAIPADTTPPADPTGLTAAAGDGKVTLSWAANTDPDIQSYKIYRDGSYIGSVLAPAHSYVASSLPNGITYGFSVSAVDESLNESAKSSTISVTPKAAPAPGTGISPNFTDWGFTATDIFTNSAFLVKAVGGFLLIYLAIRITPSLVWLIKNAVLYRGRNMGAAFWGREFVAHLNGAYKRRR